MDASRYTVAVTGAGISYMYGMRRFKNVAAFMGSFADTVCLDCGERMHDIEVWHHGGMPRCPKCGGYMVPVYFSRFGKRTESGQKAADEFMLRAQDMIAEAELLMLIGTTEFHSDEYLKKMRPSTRIVQINPGRTIFDRMADLNIRMDAEDVFGQILSEEEP